MAENFCSYLLELRNAKTPCKGVLRALTDMLLGGRDGRHGTLACGQVYLCYQEAPTELAAVVKAHGGSSLRLHHQQPTTWPGLLKPPPPPNNPQAARLPSSQKSVFAERFLKLKSFEGSC